MCADLQTPGHRRGVSAAGVGCRENAGGVTGTATNTAASRQHHEGEAGHHGGSDRLYWTFAAILLTNMQEILKRYE